MGWQPCHAIIIIVGGGAKMTRSNEMTKYTKDSQRPFNAIT